MFRVCLTLLFVAGTLAAQDSAAFAAALFRHGYPDLAASVGEAVLLDGRQTATERVSAAETLLEVAARESLRGVDAPLQHLAALLPRLADGIEAQDPVEGVRFLLVLAATLRGEAEARTRAAEEVLAVPSTRALARTEARNLQEAACALEARLPRVPAAMDARREARKSVHAAELRLFLLDQRVAAFEGGQGLSASELVARIEGLLLDIPEAGAAFRRIYMDGLLLLARVDLASGRAEPAFTAAREVLQLLEIHADANRTTMGLAERAALVVLGAGTRAPVCAAEARRAATLVLAAPAGAQRGELLLASADAALIAGDESMAGQCLRAALGHETVRAEALRRVLQREDTSLPDALLQKSLAQDALHWPALRAPVLQLLGRVRRGSVDAASRLRLDRWLAELFLTAGDPDSSARHALLAAEALRTTDPQAAKQLLLFARSLAGWSGPRMRLLSEDLARGLGLDAALKVPPDSGREVLTDLAARCDAALAARDLDVAEKLLQSLERAGADGAVLAAGWKRLAVLALETFVTAPPAEREAALKNLLVPAQRAIATGTAGEFETDLIVQLVAAHEVETARLCLPRDASGSSAELAEAAFIACVECTEGCATTDEMAHPVSEAARWYACLGRESLTFLPRRRRADALFKGGILLKKATGFLVTPVRGEVDAAAKLWAAILASTDPDSPAAWEARWYHLHLMLASSATDASANERVRNELSRLTTLTGGRFDEGPWEKAFLWLKGRLP